MICTLLLISLFSQASTKAQTDLDRLIDLGGGEAALEQFVNPAMMEKRMRSILKPENAPEERRPVLERLIKEYSEEFVAEAKKRFPELREMIAKIYVKHYSPEEIKELLDFYQTPLGKRMASRGPIVSTEIIQTSSGWGQKIGEMIGQRVGARIEAEEAAKAKPTAAPQKQ